MSIQATFSVSSAGVIDYIGNAHGVAAAEYFTVIQLHRYLGDLMDDAQAAGDDLLDITSATSSERSTDNIITLNAGYTITDTAIEHLYDGSIIQLNDGTVWDGCLVIAAEGMDLQIQQNGAIVANDFWNSIPNGETLKGLNRDVPNGISHRFLLKTVAAGVDTDGRRIIGQTRVTGKTYSEFKVNGTARGNNVLALTYADDLNDTTDASARAGIVNTAGYRLIDVDNNGTPEPYYSEWDMSTFTSKQFYERMKYITRQATAETLYGVNGEVFRGVTHEVTTSGTGTGTFAATELISWGTGGTAGTGIMLAIDNVAPASATKMWVQLLTGVAPSAAVTITGGTSAATTANSGVPNERTISAPFCGLSTGTALIGAYGFGIEYADLKATDLLRDLNNATHNPPNIVTFSVGAVVSGEDRVLVGPATGPGGTLAVGQFTLNAGIAADAATVVVKLGTETPGTATNSAVDTPSTGTIRILGDDNVYYRVTYTGFTVAAGTMTFTGCTGAPAAAIDKNVFISYVDSLYDGTTATDRFSTVYAADRDLFIRVRDGGASPIKTFETTGLLSNSGGSTTAIRTADA